MACVFLFTWQSTKSINDLLSPLLQREPVLTYHQTKHDQRHKLTSVGLYRRTRQTHYSFTETNSQREGEGRNRWALYHTFVLATPISGPALIWTPQSVSLEMELPTVLVTPTVRAPFFLQ